jgi:hypothetical protein
MITTRKRTLNTCAPTFIVVTSTTPGDSGTYPASNYTGGVSEILDNNNRNFKTIRKSGGLVLSDCQITRYERSFIPGFISASTPNGWSASQTGDLLGYFGGSVTSGQIYGPEDSVPLFIKAFAKINEASLMSGEVLRDLGVTIAMFRHPFKSASELLVKMAKYRKVRLGKTVRSAAKANADAWLEYRYGWLPIIHDSRKVMNECLVSRASFDRKRLVARAGSRRIGNQSGSWSATAVAANSGSMRIDKTSCANVGVIYDYKSQGPAEDRLKFLGLRLRDIPATLWEITPYSFVVDWFVNVGEWIQAITPVPGVTITGWWYTTTVTTISSREGRIAYLGTPPSPTWQGSFGSEIFTDFKLTRICNGPMTLMPSLKANTLSRLHQVDAMALSLKPILAAMQGFWH